MRRNALSRKSAELADGFLQGEQLFVSDILAEDAGKRPISSRVRMLSAEYAVGCGALRIIINGNPGLFEGEGNVWLGHGEDGDGHAGIVDQQIEDRVDGIFILILWQSGRWSCLAAGGVSDSARR